jgi:hypothetical protein
MEDGAFYLEDLDDKVELDLSEAVSHHSVITESVTDVGVDAGIWTVHGGIVRAR